jgi:hypothetical protein
MMAISRSLDRWMLLLFAAILPFFVVSQNVEESHSSSELKSRPYVPIENVDEGAYIGVWFQAYASASVIYTFEVGGNCVTATYSLTSKDRTIQVLNEVRPFGGEGIHRSEENWWDWDLLDDILTLKVRGYLSQSPTVDGQGYVELQPGPLPFCFGCPNIDDVMYQEPGNYWIMMLGPKRDGQYQYAVVTDGDPKVQLYVLVRNVAEFEATWKEEVLLQVHEWGFTGATNRPRQTNQENCGYDFYTDDDHVEDDKYNDDKYNDDKYNDDKYNDDH